MAGAHARLSASAAERWMNCPGSLREAAKYRNATSKAAAEGTFAHEIASECLKAADELKPDMWLGVTAKHDGHDVTCDQEMVEGVEFYVNGILASEQLGDEGWIEMPLLEALVKLHPDLGGTADYVRWRPSTRNLLVEDFKYGAGVLVTAEENKQARLYALGALLATNAPADTITVAITQPRIDHPEGRRREWTFAASEIASFAAQVVDAAEAANAPDAPLRPGYWCKKSFCPAARECPALVMYEHSLMKDDFAAPVAGNTYDLAKVAQALAMIEPLKAKIAALESFAYTEAMRGVKIPGWKLVEKQARRQIVDEAGVIQWAEERGIDPYAPRELKSPAQLEKGTKKADKEALAEFVKAKSSGTTLVPESDPRQEYLRLDDRRDFAASEGAAEVKALPAPVNLFS